MKSMKNYLRVLMGVSVVVALVVVGCLGNSRGGGDQFGLQKGDKLTMKAVTSPKKGLELGVESKDIGKVRTSSRRYVSVEVYAGEKKVTVKAMFVQGKADALVFFIPEADYKTALGTDKPTHYKAPGHSKSAIG